MTAATGDQRGRAGQGREPLVRCVDHAIVPVADSELHGVRSERDDGVDDHHLVADLDV